MSEPLSVSASIVIPADELRFTYDRSSGPGGQNVNKVNTKATLKWAIKGSASIPRAVVDRFVKRFGNRINASGEVVLQSDAHRTQARNKEECLTRLAAMLLSVAKPPRARKKTKPSKSSREKRLKLKRQRSDIKQQRRAPPGD